jgi:hypothetical protein
MTLGVLVLVMMGCGPSTKLVQSWQEPAFNDKPLEKILVLGVFENDLNRRLYEDAVVKALEKENRVGIPGYSLMSKPSEYDEKEEIVDAVGKAGADAVMLATLVGVKKEEKYMPPTVSYQPTMGFNHGMYGYYAVSYDRVVDPGYTVTNTIVKLEITVFSVKTEQMIWAGATRSFNPKSEEKLVKETAELITKDMKKAGFL